MAVTPYSHLSTVFRHMYGGKLRIGADSYHLSVQLDGFGDVWVEAVLGIGRDAKYAAIRITEQKVFSALKGGAGSLVDLVQKAVRELVRLLTFPLFRIGKGPRRLTRDTGPGARLRKLRTKP